MLSTKISDTDNFSFCYFESFLKLPLKHCCRVFLSLGTSAEKVESRTVSKKRFRQPLKRKKDKGGTFKCLNSGHRSCSLRTCPLPCRLKPKKQRSKKIIITPDLSLPVLSLLSLFSRGKVIVTSGIVGETVELKICGLN